MKIFNYDNQGYLIGVSELDDSDKCQITGEFIIPGMATEKEPPIEKEGFEIKFIENEWKYIKLLTIEEKKIQGLIPLEEGEILENDLLITIPSPGGLYSWNFDSSEWVFDDSKKQAKINEINQKAYNEIAFIYPLWKQNNIQSDYSQYPDNEIFKVEFEKMRLFINQVRANADNEVLLLENS